MRGYVGCKRHPSLLVLLGKVTLDSTDGVWAHLHMEGKPT